ncbi:DUF5696 domain-containing protein [Paenibacillus sp. LHD-117]|uniref:DUF5696 domain-containing protein n=1 Tax=Paenibacillus sp. LHD-117 TaxID=3071412 RepID=UPI0027DFA787|nr:DUF5696 domain-containing protein [Paenibacillus sp. LHD-117]MDQ6420014.1 DUF5696 domain-containing protein [Paenibacillus sp. LHD-117]
MNGRKKIALVMLSVFFIVGGLAGFYNIGSVESGQSGANAEVSAASLNAAGNRNVKNAVQTLAASSINEATSANTAAELEALGRMELAAENESLMLYVNRETAEIAVKEKQNGYAWFSNPAGRNEDPKASPLYKAELNSQLTVSYYNEKGQLNSLNSYSDSVQKKQFTIETTDRGVKVVYQLGNVSKSFDNIPQTISKERFEEAILSKIEDQEVRDDVGYSFRFDEAKQQYEIRKLQDYALEELSQMLESIGYTTEEAAKDRGEDVGGEEGSADKPEFTVPLVYSIEGDQLLVSIPGAELKYTTRYPIASIQLLKHFGAADDKKDGYIFVPDGSGALIDLNNGRLNVEPFIMPVYGNDGSFNVKERSQKNETVRLPVFGMKQEDRAFLGIIENGDAMAEVLADISGRNDSYNTVGAKFRVVSMDFYTLTAGTKKSSVPMFETKPYQGDLQIRFAFLNGTAASYTGMAGLYRNYLVQKHNLEKLEPANAPFVLELAGAFPTEKSFLGIPYESTESLTRYEEAEELLRRMKEKGVDSIALRYVGWFNGGIRHGRPSDIELVGALGGKRGFDKLTDYANQNGVALYPDAAFLQAYKKPLQAASFLDQKKAKIYEYEPVHNVKDTAFSHYIQSAAKLGKLTDKFLASYAKLGAQGLSLRDLGSEVNSDFDPKHSINRQNALRESEQAAKKLKEQVNQLMVSGGNAYSLPFADIIVNAPTASSGINLTDEEIPFYQIALHGYYDLAGTPFNMGERQDPRYELLKTLETGSTIYYQWTYKPSTVVKDTPYNDMYALYYENWLDEAAQLYGEAGGFLKSIRNMAITDHRTLQENVVQTTFENGASIIINYNKTAVQVNGIRIEARSYLLGGE